VHALTEELVKRGHEVTLFASGDSLTSAKLVSVFPRALREAKQKDIYGANCWTLLNIGLAYDMQDEFDIIHDHNAHLGVAIANMATTPVVMTVHGALSIEEKEIFNRLRKPNIVTISDSQSFPAPGLNYIGMIHNGLPMENYPFSETHEDYLLCVGRFIPEKGIHFAIETARQLNMKLIIGAKLEQVGKTYFQEYIEPYLSEDIVWVGEVDTDKRNELMSKAYCFLHPTNWREPFGLTLIEAMACGCPVVAFDKGAIPEIIENGKTGFVVQDVETMVDAVQSIGKIDRKYCREYALENFSAKKMTDEYEIIYQEALKRSKGKKEMGMSEEKHDEEEE
jgi:glycosyltransferase involved in cell wall biosynthesis